MNRIRPILNVTVILFLFIVLHNAIIALLGNTFAIMKEDNRYALLEESYKGKIEVLEEKIATYERSLEALKVYEGSNHVLAKVALRDIYDFYDFLLLNTDTHVKKGSAVINEDGLIGVVEEANKTTAKVKLVTGNVKLSVAIGGVYGMMDGYIKEDGLLVVHNIDNYKKIEVGSKVVTSGLQEIDGGLVVGVVEKTEISGVENRVYVRPQADLTKINYVMVIDK